MDLLEPTGLRGQPLATLEAVKAAAKHLDLRRAEVILLTDWQDRRERQRYAVFVHDRDRALLSEDAFGPQFGEPGTAALRELVRHLLDRGAANFKERVLPPHEFSRLLQDLPEDLVQQLNAGANPVDPLIYTQ